MLTFGFDNIGERDDENYLKYLMSKDVQDLGFCILSLLKRMEVTTKQRK